MGDNGPHDTEIYADFACAHAGQTAAIADFPGGQVGLIVLGIITAGIGGYFIYKGARQKFREDITRPSGRSQSAITVLAMTGYMAKDIAILALGVLFVVAAVKVDPQVTSGLDGALKSLATLPFGEAILVVVGIRLSAYGLYSLARALLARL